MSATTRKTPSSALAIFSRSSTFLEKYLLSLFFLFAAYQEFWVIYTRTPLLNESVQLGRGTFFAVSTKHTLYLCFEVFAGLSLLFNRAPTSQPQKLTDVLVPLIGTFFYLAFPLADRMPDPLRVNLLPTALINEAAVAGLFVSVVGYAISVWSLLFLGRSFAVLVSVRDVIRDGPYRYVRHPMYLGYGLQFAGILLSAFSPILIILSTIYLLLLIYRAKLEEAALCRSSAAYREYTKHVGFLLPSIPARG